MEHGDQFQAPAPDTVRNNIRRIWHNKLSGPDHSAKPANLWVGFKDRDCSENPVRYQSGVLFRVLLDLFSQLNEVADRSAGPDDIHRGAFVSSGPPQDFNHFETLS